MEKMNNGSSRRGFLASLLGTSISVAAIGVPVAIGQHDIKQTMPGRNNKKCRIGDTSMLDKKLYVYVGGHKPWLPIDEAFQRMGPDD